MISKANMKDIKNLTNKINFIVNEVKDELNLFRQSSFLLKAHQNTDSSIMQKVNLVIDAMNTKLDK